MTENPSPNNSLGVALDLTNIIKLFGNNNFDDLIDLISKYCEDFLDNNANQEENAQKILLLYKALFSVFPFNDNKVKHINRLFFEDIKMIRRHLPDSPIVSSILSSIANPSMKLDQTEVDFFNQYIFPDLIKEINVNHHASAREERLNELPNVPIKNAPLDNAERELYAPKFDILINYVNQLKNQLHVDKWDLKYDNQTNYTHIYFSLIHLEVNVNVPGEMAEQEFCFSAYSDDPLRFVDHIASKVSCQLLLYKLTTQNSSKDLEIHIDEKKDSPLLQHVS